MQARNEQVLVAGRVRAVSIASAHGHAADLSSARHMCAEMWRRDQPGTVGDVMARTREKQLRDVADLRLRRMYYQGHFETTQLMRAANENSITRVRTLIAVGARIRTRRDNHGYTALHWASEAGASPAVIEALLRVGWEGHEDVERVDSLTHEHYTPLMLASVRGHADVVRTLLAHGADQTLWRAANRSTSMHLAVELDQKHVLQVLCADAARGAAAMAQENSDGETPLDIANANGFAECIEVLESYEQAE